MATARAGTNAAIENQRLRVEVDRANNTFTMHDRGTGKDFVKSATLARAVASIAAVQDVEDPVWGSGREILISHPGGWTTSLRLFRGHPFLHLHTTTHDEDEEPLVTAALQLLDFEVDLGRPAKELKSFGRAFSSRLTRRPAASRFPPSSTRIPATGWLPRT